LTWLLQHTASRACACTPSPSSDASARSESRARDEGAPLPVLPPVSPRGPVERSWPLLTEAKGALCGARPLGLLPIRISVAGPSHAFPSWTHMLRGSAPAAVCCFRVWACRGKEPGVALPLAGMCVPARVGFCLMRRLPVAAFPSQLCAHSTLTPPLAALRAQGSAQKSDADEATGRPLEELTKGIVESNGLVRLGPLISQLHHARQTQADLLQEDTQLKTASEALAASRLPPPCMRATPDSARGLHSISWEAFRAAPERAFACPACIAPPFSVDPRACRCTSRSASASRGARRLCAWSGRACGRVPVRAGRVRGGGMRGDGGAGGDGIPHRRRACPAPVRIAKVGHRRVIRKCATRTPSPLPFLALGAGGTAGGPNTHGLVCAGA